MYFGIREVFLYLCTSLFLTDHVGSPAELGEDEPFLCTEQGSPFSPVFRHIRLQYIINDLASARILERDNIVPPGKDPSTRITAASRQSHPQAQTHWVLMLLISAA